MKDKFPLVVGLGATGSSLIDYLSNFHEEIFLIEDWESNPNLEGIYQKESQININPLLDEDMCEMISKVYPSPGVSKDHEIFNFATKNKIPISSDIQEFLENNNCFKILVTGTNGKTSTCLMIKRLFESFFPELYVAALGNIGEPVLKYIDQNLDVSIIEVSSFQLDLLNETEFEIGLLLNIEQDHIDRHGTFENYKEAKQKVLKNSHFNISFNEDNFYNKNFKNYRHLNEPKDFFESSIFMDWPLHDKQNLKASIQVLKVFLNNFKSNDYKEEDLYANIRKTFKDFTRPPHRYEFVSSFTGIDFINDSKSTNLDSMLMAVRSVHHNKQKGEIYLICGGDSKGQDFIKTDLSELKNVKNIFIYGKDKKIICNSVQKYSTCKSVIDLETAFNTTLSMAKKGDTVLFSPACSSLDMFKDYQERGNRFKSLVKDL